MPEFPVGYRDFHANPSLNFELNRWLPALPEAELAAAARRIASARDWPGVMLELARRAEREERWLNAAFYFRAAEFFLPVDAAEKREAYERFVALFDRAVDKVAAQRTRVPFGSAWLPAIAIPALGEERDVVLLHGGFDSLMEELYDFGLALADDGYRVILFDGPGQGAALRRHGLCMSPEWERPVAAVLDHFAVERCAILGLSLGGYLAPRAAAFEPRIRRVICWDVLDDFFDCFAARSRATAAILGTLSRLGLRAPLNALVRSATGRDPDLAWVIGHGMHVCGARDPFDFVGWLRALRTRELAPLITQDVLLLAGAEDHIVPLRQFHRQARHLPNARSLTGRIFTRAEHAQNHCQIGNVALALDVIRAWLRATEAAP